jgi:hypothetical protein
VQTHQLDCFLFIVPANCPIFPSIEYGAEPFQRACQMGYKNVRRRYSGTNGYLLTFFLAIKSKAANRSVTETMLISLGWFTFQGCHDLLILFLCNQAQCGQPICTAKTSFALVSLCFTVPMNPTPNASV